MNVPGIITADLKIFGCDVVTHEVQFAPPQSDLYLCTTLFACNERVRWAALAALAARRQTKGKEIITCSSCWTGYEGILRLVPLQHRIMQGEQGLPLPSSLQEVEAVSQILCFGIRRFKVFFTDQNHEFLASQLILALYEPGPPETISRIQELLHRVQKSPEGWQLAQSLLVNSNDTIKFFGALTIIVKLNTER